MTLRHPVAPGGTVAYVVKRFPRLSETFILNEILALQRQGLRIEVASLLRADNAVTHGHAVSLGSGAFYLPESVWRSLPRLLLAQAHFLVRSPGRWVAALTTAVRGHSLKGVKHWLRGGLVARRFEGSDVRHFHAHFSNSPTSVAMVASELLGVRYSVSCHAKDVYADGRLHAPAFHRHLAGASFVVVVSERTKMDILEAWPDLPPEKIRVIYNGLDLERFKPRPSEPGGRVVLSVGRFVEKKGFPNLIEAYGLLRDRDVPFEGEIVGYGAMKKDLVESVSSHGLDGRVRLLGALPQEELILRYKGASLFCLATQVADNDDRDILPNVLKEAMAVGVPVVTTSIPGMEELVQNERTGLLIPPKDAGALARGLERMLGDDELRCRLALEGRKFIEERFDRSKNTSELLRLFERQVVGAAATGSEEGKGMAQESGHGLGAGRDHNHAHNA